MARDASRSVRCLVAKSMRALGPLKRSKACLQLRSARPGVGGLCPQQQTSHRQSHVAVQLGGRPGGGASPHPTEPLGRSRPHRHTQRARKPGKRPCAASSQRYCLGKTSTSRRREGIRPEAAQEDAAPGVDAGGPCLLLEPHRPYELHSVRRRYHCQPHLRCTLAPTPPPAHTQCPHHGHRRRVETLCHEKGLCRGHCVVGMGLERAGWREMGGCKYLIEVGGGNVSI